MDERSGVLLVGLSYVVAVALMTFAMWVSRLPWKLAAVSPDGPVGGPVEGLITMGLTMTVVGGAMVVGFGKNLRGARVGVGSVLGFACGLLMFAGVGAAMIGAAFALLLGRLF